MQYLALILNLLWTILGLALTVRQQIRPAVTSDGNIVTVAGNFNKDKKQYENRVIVVSELI